MSSLYDLNMPCKLFTSPYHTFRGQDDTFRAVHIQPPPWYCVLFCMMYFPLKLVVLSWWSWRWRDVAICEQEQLFWQTSSPTSSPSWYTSWQHDGPRCDLYGWYQISFPYRAIAWCLHHGGRNDVHVLYNHLKCEMHTDWSPLQCCANFLIFVLFMWHSNNFDI